MTPEGKAALESASAPPVKLITIGDGEKKVQVGNETVLFRHEETFYHETGIAIQVSDSLSEAELIEKLRDGGIRDYLQDMKNSRGISMEESHLPSTTLQVAESGYKKGEVVIEGVIDEKEETMKTGESAVQAKIGGIRKYISGMMSMSDEEETRQALFKVLNEVDETFPPPEQQ